MAEETIQILNLKVQGAESVADLRNNVTELKKALKEAEEQSNTPEGYAGVCVLFHIWKDGQDYLIPCDKENTDYLTYFGERAMFFYSNRGGHSDSAYVSVILQLCGGESFVKREDTAEIRALFPDEILLENTFAKLPLQEYSVSPLTAFLLGWNGYIDTQLIPFTDK